MILTRPIIAAFAVMTTIADTSAETALERGQYLMNGIVACGNCHTIQTPDGPLTDKELAGGLKIEEPGMSAYPPNITPDKETGIGKWSDEEIIVAIREGKRPDGSIIGPPMPFGFYRSMSDEDVKAIVAYVRSVKPVTNKVAKSEYKFPLPPAYGPPVKNVPTPDSADKVAYGAYLAGPLGHCMECHSGPDEKGIPDPVNKLGAGGVQFHGPWGVSVAPNITPTGLAKWSDKEIKTVITKGIRPNGSRLMPPMGVRYYTNIAEKDLDAIVAYLRQLPAK